MTLLDHLREKDIPLLHTAITLLLTTCLVAGLGGFFLYSQYQEFERESQRMTRQLLDQQKNQVKQHVESVKDYIYYMRAQSETVLKRTVREETDKAIAILESIYIRHQGKMPEMELKKLLIESLRPLRFYDGRGYYFIDDMRGKCILLPTNPRLENSSLLDNQDDTGHYIMRGLIDAVSNPNAAGFSRYRWYRPAEKIMSDKITYVRQFKPYQWIVGTGEYVRTIEEDIQKEALQRIEKLKFDHDGYFVILEYTGKIILHGINNDLVGKNIVDMQGIDGKAVLGKIQQAARNKGGFIQYRWYKQNAHQQSDKISYVVSIPEWNWVILAGSFLDDLHIHVDSRKKQLEVQLEQQLHFTIVILLITVAMSVALSLFFSHWLKSLFDQYRFDIEERNRRLNELNATLENRVFDELRKNREKDHLLIQQSRSAAMGDMIHNIAHQWRQPLNALALVIANIRDAWEYGELDLQILKQEDTKAQQLIQRMSRTIDDFRNFFRPDKKEQIFIVNDCVHDSLSLIEASLQHHQIKVDIQIEEGLNLLGHSNEYAQVLLNILANAKDALLEKNPTPKSIKIRGRHYNGQVVVEISDNAGGIADEILPRIFDPYFSTKENGSGIGLYMSRMIIEQSMKGNIAVNNNVAGAVFCVSCPAVDMSQGERSSNHAE